MEFIEQLSIIDDNTSNIIIDVKSSNIIIEPDYVLYHGGCFDGFTGAYACFLKYPNNKNITYIPMGHNFEYNDEFIEQFRDKKVVVIDYSTPYDVTNKITAITKEFLIIDHHVSAQKDLENIDDKYKIFDMKFSGAVLAYKYFFPDLEIPLGFQYIQDRDIWKWEFDESKPFTSALFMKFNIKKIDDHYQKFKEYDDLINENKINNLIDCGNTIIEVNTSIINNQINYFQKIKIKNSDFNNFNGAILNSSVFPSEIGNILSSKVSIDFAIIYTHQFNVNDDQNTWNCSIRSNSDECNVSLIAKSFGGGGHVRASGFRLKGNLNDYFEFGN